MYTEVEVIVLGAVDHREIFEESEGLDEFLAQVETEAKLHGEHTEVYVYDHDHDLSDEECACVQYHLDHNPIYVYLGGR